MFTDTDYDRLQQLMAESPENEALLQKLLRSHQETVSMISHEIRNPLTLVYSTLQLIESMHPEVNSFKYWDSLRSDIKYMTALLEELSALTHSTTLSLETIDFCTFMKQLVISFAVSCTDSPVEFTSYIDPALPKLRADRIKLREVFFNLLRNARESITSSGTIRLEAHDRDGHIQITIQDSGCGIPEEYLADIFTPFVTHKIGGTGLGLAIAKRIIESHKGTIQVSSKVNMGTTFTVSFPVS